MKKIYQEDALAMGYMEIVGTVPLCDEHIAELKRFTSQQKTINLLSHYNKLQVVPVSTKSICVCCHGAAWMEEE